jgi:hypothetical protein
MIRAKVSLSNINNNCHSRWYRVYAIPIAYIVQNMVGKGRHQVWVHVMSKRSSQMILELEYQYDMSCSHMVQAKSKSEIQF